MRAAQDACPPDDPLAGIRAQLHAYSQFAIDSPGHYRLLINNRSQRAPEGAPTDILGHVVAAFERCEQTGITLRIPPLRAAIVVFVGTHGRVALWHASDDPDLAKDIPAFVDELIELVVD
jgi:Tetracyclin repressor-like, C-terminal domain